MEGTMLEMMDNHEKEHGGTVGKDTKGPRHSLANYMFTSLAGSLYQNPLNSHTFNWT